MDLEKKSGVQQWRSLRANAGETLRMKHGRYDKIEDDG